MQAILKSFKAQVAVVAVVALAAFVATTQKANAMVFYGDYGHGTLTVECAPAIHMARFSVEMTSSYGLGYNQAIAYGIYVYRYQNGGWAYLGTSGVVTSVNSITGTWWGNAVTPGLYAFKVIYSWQVGNQWVSGQEWATTYSIDYNRGTGQWYRTSSSSTSCYL